LAAGGGESSITLETLLYGALTTPGNESPQTELSAQSNEIMEFLDSHDFALPGTAAELLEDLWIAQVYEAIAGSSTGAATLRMEHTGTL
jgi:hypothetical protein